MSYLTDQELIGAVLHCLARDGRVNPADVIHVTAENGVVRLTGTVQSAAQKHAAEEAARQVPDLVVENDLTVAMEGEIADAELQAGVMAALAGSPELVARVGCRVDDGIVTLVGHVQDAAQEDEAMRVAGAVKGVKQVVSALEIAAVAPDETALPIDDATLVGKLAEALARAGVTVRDHEFRVDQGVATLHGRVASEKERRRAGAIAAAVEGIRAVHNRLIIGRVVFRPS